MPLVVLAVVFSPGWLPSTGPAVVERPEAARSMLAPGAETGVLRVTPTALRLEGQRPLDRRPLGTLAVIVLAGCLGMLGMAIAVTLERRRAGGREPRSTRGSRAPPRLSPA